MHIRKAVVQDIKAIQKILNYYAKKDFLLPRSLSELYDHLRDYFVLENTDQKHLIQGVCGLGISWEDLAEIKSLAISEGHQSKGLGSQFVEMCLEEARSLGIKKVFALTYIPNFFVKLGFREVEKSVLPNKIWADCLKCPKFPDCGEIAVLIDL
jgi:amino-acid N-acetyltransferase